MKHATTITIIIIIIIVICLMLNMSLVCRVLSSIDMAIIIILNSTRAPPLKVEIV